MAELHILALSTVYILGIGYWQADLISWQCLDVGKWSLHLEVFKELLLVGDAGSGPSGLQVQQRSENKDKEASGVN